MPRTLAIDPRVPATHGLLIRRHTIAEQTRAHTTIKEARAYARRIVKEAQLQAESIQQQAMEQGFSDGWQDSLNVIYQSLHGMEELHQHIEKELKHAVHKALESALSEPSLELQLLEGWLSNTPVAPSNLHLVLPRRAQSQAPVIIRRMEEALKITPTIAYSETDHVVIECGEQVFEFSPSRILDEIDHLALNCLRRLDVKKQCAVWSQHNVQHWLADLAQRHHGILTNHREATLADLDELDALDELDDFEDENEE